LCYGKIIVREGWTGPLDVGGVCVWRNAKILYKIILKLNTLRPNILNPILNPNILKQGPSNPKAIVPPGGTYSTWNSR
jgi:hypothetical protein